jgi:2-phosphosulfolactate phosphatase
MNIEVFLTSTTIPEEDVEDRIVLVVDVLRASSTIITALHNGARSVIPVTDLGQAGKIASNLDQASYLLGGERNGEPIEGYHLGNSPREYDAATVRDKTIILSTTNGTGAIARALGARHLAVAAFLNADAAVSFVQDHPGLDLTIICAGWKNRVSLEDTLCAGLLLHRLWEGRDEADLTDSARISLTQYRRHAEDLSHTVTHSNHAERLTRLGMQDDIGYCLQVDAFDLLPVYKENKLIPFAKSKARKAI